MLSKAHLTSHSRMSGSRWVITLLWLSGLSSSSVYSCYPLISSTSLRFIPFLSFIVLIFAWNVPLVSLIFLKRSLVFPILLFSSISLHWSLKKAFLSLLAILWISGFKWVYLSLSSLPLVSLLFWAICKASSDNHFAFLQDGGGIGWETTFSCHKFIKRSFECWTTSTKQLLNTGRGHLAPRKAAHSLWKKVGQNIKDKYIYVCVCVYICIYTHYWYYV